jgi:ribonuclease R
VLKRLLRELEDEGRLTGRRRRPVPAGEREGLPAVTVVTVIDVDDEGDLLCRAQQDARARILLPVEAQEGKAPGPGDRVLARLFPRGHGRYDAHLIKLLPRPERAVVGVVETSDDGFRIRPIERSAKLEYRLRPDGLGGAAVGDLVRAEVLGADRPMALPLARVTERVGRFDDPRAVSLALAVGAGLPMAFSEAALAEASKAKPVALGKRRDLRDLDLVTIDGEDARDFDDAVWAEPDRTKGNPGGYRIVVAIADVAHYVRQDSALDLEARERGNSVYFPDRVIPMLPEALSNDLCSLRPDEERACFAILMRIDALGRLIEKTFRRALMRSRARLTYAQVQAARDGMPDALTAPLMEAVVRKAKKLIA